MTTILIESLNEKVQELTVQNEAFTKAMRILEAEKAHLDAIIAELERSLGVKAGAGTEAARTLSGGTK